MKFLVFLKNRYFIFLIITSLLIIVGIFLPELLSARPGGGHSYSGGGSGGGGGGGGGGELVEILLYLFLMLPFPVQLFIIVTIIIVVIISHFKGGGEKANTYVHNPRNNYAVVKAQQEKIDNLIKEDQTFSEILFLDFAHSLYHKFYTSINSPQIKELTPFLSPEIKRLNSDTNKKNDRKEVVVGNLMISDIVITAEQQKIIVDYQANYTVVSNNKNYRHIVEERWVLVRKIGVKSANPEVMQDLACPSCGAPNDFNDAGVCGYCGTLVEGGEMNWMLNNITILNHQHFEINTLGTYAPEVGTNFPTVIDPFLREKGERFIAMNKIEDPSAYWDNFMNNIVEVTFKTMYKAWSDRDNWNSVRHLLSDRLYESNDFWIKTYQEKDYYNRLENIQLEETQLARISVDNYYESMTVRIFASAIDYTENKNGKLIGGDKKKARRFTEYWTFIRKVGIEKSESKFDVASCPNCGAPADKMSDSSVCGYCSTKTNLGDFSWVLSSIIQDEVYKG